MSLRSSSPDQMSTLLNGALSPSGHVPPVVMAAANFSAMVVLPQPGCAGQNVQLSPGKPAEPQPSNRLRCKVGCACQGNGL